MSILGLRVIVACACLDSPTTIVKPAPSPTRDKLRAALQVHVSPMGVSGAVQRGQKRRRLQSKGAETVAKPVSAAPFRFQAGYSTFVRLLPLPSHSSSAAADWAECIPASAPPS